MSGLKIDTPRDFVGYMVLAIFGKLKSNLGKQMGHKHAHQRIL
jgi:hypothetical protein